MRVDLALDADQLTGPLQVADTFAQVSVTHLCATRSWEFESQRLIMKKHECPNDQMEDAVRCTSAVAPCCGFPSSFDFRASSSDFCGF
jgi:hypothetical protein